MTESTAPTLPTRYTPAEFEDAIYHLAAAVGVRLVIAEPVHTIETNIGETSAVLEHAAQSKTPTLIAASQFALTAILKQTEAVFQREQFHALEHSWLIVLEAALVHQRAHTANKAGMQRRQGFHWPTGACARDGGRQSFQQGTGWCRPGIGLPGVGLCLGFHRTG